MPRLLKTTAWMAVGAALSVLAGCANQPKSLYNWSDYQPQVYAYLKNDGEGVDAQILKLEQNMALARSKGETLPPWLPRPPRHAVCQDRTCRRSQTAVRFREDALSRVQDIH